MKILAVCQYYWPEPFNISEICEELVARGHEVMVFIREKRIGEIPQFWDVFKGDIILIGLRSERPAFCKKSNHRWNHRAVVRPSFSGLAVVGGYDLFPKEKVRFGLKSIQVKSWFLDLKFIFKPLGIVKTGEGAR